MFLEEWFFFLFNFLFFRENFYVFKSSCFFYFLNGCCSINGKFSSTKVYTCIRNTIQVFYVLFELCRTACSGESLHTVHSFLICFFQTSITHQFCLQLVSKSIYSYHSNVHLIIVYTNGFSMVKQLFECFNKIWLLSFHLNPLPEFYILDVFFISLKVFIPAKMHL